MEGSKGGEGKGGVDRERVFVPLPSSEDELFLDYTEGEEMIPDL